MKKFSCILLMFSLVFGLLIVTNTVYAEETKTWQDAGIPVPVAPDDYDVFEIYTPEQLAWVAQIVNHPTSPNTFENFTVRLKDDIDLSSRKWFPIGGWNGTDAYSSFKFCGTFDGNHKTIYGLTIDDDRLYYVGLFGVIDGEVKDLNIVGAKISASKYASVGTLAGRLESDSEINIQNISASTDIYSYSYSDVGGLFGEISASCNIGNCCVSGTIDSGSNSSVGGFAGTSRASIVNSYSNVSNEKNDGFKSYHGGFIGINYGTLINCYFNSSYCEVGVGSGDQDAIGKTNEDIFSKSFTNLLNDNDKLLFSEWIQSSEGNPILSINGVNKNKYWIYNSKPVTESENGTYYIYTVEQLAWIAEQTFLGNSFDDKTIFLMNDIDLSKKFWTPIGISSRSGLTGVSAFKGFFDGNNKKIYGLKIGTENLGNTLYKYVGFVGNSYNAGIKNISIVDAAIFVKSTENSNWVGSESYVGVILGRGNNDLVSNSNSSGVVYSDLNSTAGGISGTGTVRDSYSSCNIYASDSSTVGGLIGSGNAQRAYAIGNVSAGNDSVVGGLIGYSSYQNVSEVYSFGNLKAGKGSTIGGIIGENYRPNTSSKNIFWNKSAQHILDNFPVANTQKRGIGYYDGYLNRDPDYAIGLSLQEMKNIDNYKNAGWDFDVWGYNEKYNNGCPYLKILGTPSKYQIQAISINGYNTENNQKYINISAPITCSSLPENEIVIISSYNNNGALQTYEVSNEFLENNIATDNRIIYTTSVPINDETARLKIFIWSNWDTILPQSNCAVLELDFTDH